MTPTTKASVSTVAGTGFPHAAMPSTTYLPVTVVRPPPRQTRKVQTKGIVSRPPEPTGCGAHQGIERVRVRRQSTQRMMTGTHRGLRGR